MARQEQRTARKDYPDHGIKKGDTYFFAKIKTGQRSSRIIRSLKRIPQSQLTTSPFKSGWYAMQEAWEASSREADDIRAAAQEITDLGDQAQESFDNMPEGLQQGDTGQMLENRAQACQDAAATLDALADEFEALDKPDELGDEDQDEELENAWEEYEQECTRISEEADELIGDMPE